MTHLPLRDGALFVDNSMLELLTTCPRALEYNRLWRRISAAEKPSLFFGSAIHAALEHRYKTYKTSEPDAILEDEQAALLEKMFAGYTSPEGDFRTLNWAIEVVRRYNQRYQFEPFNLIATKDGQPLVELPFAVKLFDYDAHHACREVYQNYPEWEKLHHNHWEIPVYYTGKIDLPVMLDGTIFVIDHKTTSLLGSQFFERMKMSAQLKGYCWAFEQATGMPVGGYMVNAIRVKEPPQKLTGGKPAEIEKWWQESLARERYLVSHSLVNEWRDNTIALVEELFWYHEKGYFPQKTAWCTQFGRCQYYDVCNLDASDRGLMLNSGLYTDNTWSPLREPSAPRQ